MIASDGEGSAGAEAARVRLVFGLVLLLAAALRLAALGSESLWYDEAFAWAWVQQPHAALWGPPAAIEPNPPFYYSLLRAWRQLFGDSEAALRAPSAVCGVLS